VGAFVITALQCVGLLVKPKKSSSKALFKQKYKTSLQQERILNPSPECFGHADAFILEKHPKLHIEKV